MQEFAGWLREKYVQRHRGVNQPATGDAEIRDEGGGKEPRKLLLSRQYPVQQLSSAHTE